jgi:hypothetical protein
MAFTRAESAVGGSEFALRAASINAMARRDIRCYRDIDRQPIEIFRSISKQYIRAKISKKIRKRMLNVVHGKRDLAIDDIQNLPRSCHCVRVV